MIGAFFSGLIGLVVLIVLGVILYNLPWYVWAAAARRNPHNGVVTMGGYTPKRYRPNEPVDDLDEILFTGFPAAKRAELEALAAGAGMRVVKSVTMDLMYLCTGPNAGPSKIDKANEVGAALIDEAQFLSLI